MARRFSTGDQGEGRSWRLAAAAVACLALAGTSRAAPLVLPAPSAPTSIRAVSTKVVATARPDGLLDVDITIALLNPDAREATASLTLPALQDGRVAVGGASLAPVQPGFVMDLDAGEATAIRLTGVMPPEALDWVDEAEAGWAGMRGPLLQPALRVTIAHPERSPFAAAPLTARVVMGGARSIAEILASPPARLAPGEASWESVSLPDGAALTVTWPVLSGLLPRDAAEAEGLALDLRAGGADIAAVGALQRAVAAQPDEPEAGAAAAVLQGVMAELERRDRERIAAAADAERRTREAAEAQARAEADRQAREAAEAQARAEADRQAREAAEAQARAEADRQTREAAEAQARAEADRQARETAEAQARAEADRRARETAEAQARAEADRRARETAEAQARAEADRQAREAAESQARAEADRQAREAAEAQARAEAGRQAREAVEAQARAEADRQAREAAEAQARAETGKQAREPAEADRQAREAAEAQARAEADKQAREAAEAQARTEADRQARAEAERQARDAAEAQARAERDRQARLEAERQARDLGAAPDLAEPAADPQPVPQPDPQPDARPPADTASVLAHAESERGEAADELARRADRERAERAWMAASGPRTPWIRSAAQARVFLARESAAGTLSRDRVTEVIALMRARRGEPFDYEPRWRERFGAEPWYAPRSADALLPPTSGEIEALQVLAAAL